MRARILVVHSPESELERAAGEVASVFEGAGADAAVRAASAVTDVAAYDSVVVCGRLGARGWRDAVVDFLGAHRHALAPLSVAYLVAVPDDFPVTDKLRSLERGLGFVLNWYNELRPVKLGLFHLGRPESNARVRQWAESLKPNFVDPDFRAPSGIRSFMEAHPVECGDMSHLPVAGYRTDSMVDPRGRPGPQ
ncbi:MAG: hypothetical protein JST54_18920 [Deltaproteobacteria bacterium]|nr:hypothetical protein [Deltaproteobacteria bacterium]